MLAGWLADHEWRPLALALAMAGAAFSGVAHGAATPLGEGYAGLDLAGAAVLLGSAGFALALRSRVSDVLHVRGPRWGRLLWLGATGATLALILSLSLGHAGHGAARVVDLAATVGFLAGALALLAGEGLALTFVLWCAAATMATPTNGSQVPWWSVVLDERGGAPRLLVSVTVIAAVAVLYVGNRWGRATY